MGGDVSPHAKISIDNLGLFFLPSVGIQNQLLLQPTPTKVESGLQVRVEFDKSKKERAATHNAIVSENFE